MSEFKEKLRDSLEKLSDLLSTTMESVENPTEGEVGVPEVAQAMRRLADSIHMRASSQPKDVKYLRLSRLNAVLLSQVITRWSAELDRVCEEYTGLARALSSACDSLDKGSREFDMERDELLSLVENMVPELDIKHELTEADRT